LIVPDAGATKGRGAMARPVVLHRCTLHPSVDSATLEEKSLAEGEAALESR
jgi:hypothetical protein